jgi:ATP/maltotriose-dependent transcriptional regulator MalT
VKYLQGDLKSAKSLMNEGLEIAREINDKRQITRALIGLGGINWEEDFEAAQKYYEEAYAIAEKESLNLLLPYCIACIALVAFQMENYQASHSSFLKTLQLCEETEDQRITCVALNGLAALAVKAGEIKKAARLCGATQAFYEEIGGKIGKFELDFNERYTNEARAKVGNEIFDAELRQGRLMEVKKAIAIAREKE